MNKTDLECLAIAERRAYFRAWRAANRDKTSEHRRKYWEKKAMERLNALGSEAIADGAKHGG